jgi:putative N6-adenine-specific DNA methylase
MGNTEHAFIVPCLFGLESFVADEIRNLGYKAASENGRVRFYGDMEAAARVNMWMRCGERVLLLMGEFEAKTFSQLFEGTKAIEWENLIPKNGAFPVKGHSLNSVLFSIPDCQAIIKKAVVERLKSKYNINWFEERGPKYQIQFSIMKDKVNIMVDMSGEGLHKRGYRKEANDAPLRETLAAAMVKISRYGKGMPLLDPMCGSGTIVIEAAMQAANIAPGLNRTFTFTSWDNIYADMVNSIRQEAREGIIKDKQEILGSDISPKWVSLAAHNAAKAKVENYIKFTVCDVADQGEDGGTGIIITNPPYGERLLELASARELYKVLGGLSRKRPYWKIYILTSDESFEKYFGQKADKKRKLYNGMIKCDLYQYFRRNISFPKKEI